MWVYARTGRTSFSGNIVFAVFSMIAFFSSSYIAYSHYKCNHYSMTVLQSKLKTLEVKQPNLYNKASADTLLTSYAKCYEMGCPRQYFYEEYLPDVVYNENKTVTNTDKSNEESSNLWIWIVGVLVILLIFRKNMGNLTLHEYIVFIVTFLGFHIAVVYFIQKNRIDKKNLLNDVSLTDSNLCVQIEMKPYRFFKKRLSKQDYSNTATRVLDLNEVERMYVNRYYDNLNDFFMSWLPNQLKEINPILTVNDIEISVVIIE